MTTCEHCGLPSERGRFCCAGCEQVHALIRSNGLERYYELRGDKGQPATSGVRIDRAWLEPVVARLAASNGLSRVELDVQGVHCSACVWLIERLFEKSGGTEIVVNPTSGRVSIVAPASFDLAGFASSLERCGYVLGPARRGQTSHARTLVLRLGIAAAATMNAMIFSIAIYAGLSEGPLHRLFDAIDFGLASLVVLVGGTVFFRSALEGLRRRVLHLDLPIALGIAASYSGSIWMWTHGRAPYFDTVCVFTTLMIAGRWLHARMLEKNRNLLLEGDGAVGLLTRKEDHGRSVIAPCTSIHAGDRLMIMPGDLFPVSCKLASACECSLDWINGESEPRSFAQDEIVPAGAFSCASRAVVAIAETDFESSSLIDLLRTPSRDVRSQNDPFWSAISRHWVTAVLVLASTGFAGWTLATKDALDGLAVATAVLVVTCPCAFGIATPLAYDLALARLRAAGLFVRTPDFLDRASRVKNVVFDKTGTLTTASLRLENWEDLDALDDVERIALATLAAASGHPKATAVDEAMRRRAKPAEATVMEIPGEGVVCKLYGSLWRLGKQEDDLAFSRDGKTVVVLVVREDLRVDAKREIHALERQGKTVFILSGDAPSRVAEMARTCGIPESRAIGGMSPKDKATWIEAHDKRDTLMIGDGVNDLASVRTAFCSGTPAVDRPFVAARSDFYFVTPGLGPIRFALDLSAHLRRVVRRSLTTALLYNVLAVSLSLAGVMSPLVCAVLMPVSSLTSVALVVMGMRRFRWTSS